MSIGGRKPPGHNSLVQNPPDRGVLNQGLCPGGLGPPILKFSFQVGDVWFGGFYTALPLNGGLWPGGGVMFDHRQIPHYIYTAI